MSRITRKEWYTRVNVCWPGGGAILPALTAPEAIRAARKLYRFATGDTWEPEPFITSGNRYSYIRGGFLYLNPERGWKTFVHDLSHAFSNDPHGPDHARLEMRMIKEVIKRGWLSGNLKDRMKPEKPKPDPRSQKHARILARIETWERKRKRAETALKKLRRQANYYERALYKGPPVSDLVH